jgi:hypothetical protein
MKRLLITAAIFTSLIAFQNEEKSQPNNSKKTETTMEKSAIEKINLARLFEMLRMECREMTTGLETFSKG